VHSNTVAKNLELTMYINPILARFLEHQIVGSTNLIFPTGRWAEFFLFHGPILFILKANLVLCVLAFVQDKRTKQYKIENDASPANQTDNIQR
jgi:hypothetical protein